MAHNGACPREDADVLVREGGFARVADWSGPSRLVEKQAVLQFFGFV